jgi:hypothetical protein
LKVEHFFGEFSLLLQEAEEFSSVAVFQHEKEFAVILETVV